MGVATHLLLIGFGIFELVLVLRYFLRGKNVALLNPKGLIAHQQMNLIFYTVGILLIVAVPTIFLLYFVAWKYRESNNRATYDANQRLTKRGSLGLWAIPTVVVLLLTVVMIPATHRLAPKKVISSDAATLKVQVIALRWKWLFIYPEQKVASLNYLQIPVDIPVTFELTTDEAPMSSFWIPNLGGQLYTMTGHVNRLNLIATTAGEYPGSSAEINGAGFSKMRFTARASSVIEFEQWVQEAKNSNKTLDMPTYKDMVRPSEGNQATLYASYDDALYDTVVAKYTGSSRGHSHH
jgi:cytochrome o ubiquinol oxidase subunit 2